MSKNPTFCNDEENEKVTRNPHADLDHHEKLITSRGSPLAHACHVWSTAVSAFVCYPVYRTTRRSHNLALLTEVKIISNPSQQSHSQMFCFLLSNIKTAHNCFMCLFSHTSHFCHSLSNSLLHYPSFFLTRSFIFTTNLHPQIGSKQSLHSFLELTALQFECYSSQQVLLSTALVRP